MTARRGGTPRDRDRRAEARRVEARTAEARRVESRHGQPRRAEPRARGSQQPRARTTQQPRSRSTQQPRSRPAPQRQRPRPQQRAVKARPRKPHKILRLGDPRRRLSIAFIVVCVLFSLFGGRLVQLQGIEASAYAQAAAGERVRTVDLPASRGEILDRNGVALAQSVDAYDVVVDQHYLRQESSPSLAARKLAGVLAMDRAQLASTLTGTKRFAYVARQVTPEVADLVKRAKVPGVYTERVARRHYPSDGVAGNIVGFAGIDSQGLFGIEQGYDAVLAGKPGQRTYWEAPSGAAIPTDAGSEVAPTRGSDVRLTIDRDLQWYAEQVVSAKVAQAAAKSGCAVIMDAKTAELLAMACTPTVDPNDPAATARSDRGHKAVEESYEPGSVQKVMTAAAVIDSGAVTVDTVFSVPDHLARGGETIHDHSGHPTEQLTFAGIIAESSNVGTMLAAERMDKALMRDYLARFGLGRPLNLGLPGETPGNLAGAEWEDLTRDTIAFGQGLAVNIVQMASAYQTIANGGVRVPPMLVKQVAAPDGSTSVPERGEPARVVSEQTADAVTYLMEGVMQPGGTGKRIDVPGYRLAGKSGTAQRVGTSGGYDSYTSSFMGFAPADDPQIVVAVSIQAPVNGSGGAALAGPVFADLTSFALQHLAVPPSGTDAPQVRLTPG